MIGAASVDGHADDEDRAVGAGVAVDHRRGGDADFGRDLPASVIAAGGLVRAEDRGLPDLRAGVRVESVDSVMFRGDKDDVARRAAGGEAGENQRLRVDFAVDRQNAQQAEFRRGDVARGERCFGGVEPGAAHVEVIRGDVNAGRDDDLRLNREAHRCGVTEAGRGCGELHGRRCGSSAGRSGEADGLRRSRREAHGRRSRGNARGQATGGCLDGCRRIRSAPWP